jgi:hypothetical protein
MQLSPPNWINQRKPRGSVALAGTSVFVDLGEAETILERIAICMSDGNLPENQAEELALHEYRQRKR